MHSLSKESLMVVDVVDHRPFNDLRKMTNSRACTEKPFALLPRLFPKATEIIGRALKSVSPFSFAEMLLILSFKS